MSKMSGYKIGSGGFAVQALSTVEVFPEQQADSDLHLVELWIHDKAEKTQEAYALEIKRFFAFVGKPLASIKLGDIQEYQKSLSDLAPSTQARSLAAIKSLFAFGQRIGYLQWNPAMPLRSPKIKNTLAERILSEEDVRRMIQAETDLRDRAILKLLYAAALRASELCGLKWRDIQPRGNTAQVTVFGKGGKTGVVLLPESVWQDLKSLPGEKLPDNPIFPSAKNGGNLSRQQLWRIVKRAAKRVGLTASTHYLRHCHASHSLDRGASIALVQQTLRHSSVATTSKYLHVRPNESSGDFLAL